jgi:transcriptional regulator with XRE-family HTH domain
MARKLGFAAHSAYNCDMEKFRLWLQSEFAKRCSRNPSYSLRSLSKKLNMDPSTVSQLLRGKRKASPKLAEKIVRELQGDWNLIQPNTQGINFTFSGKEDYALIEDYALQALSIWYYPAILESTFISNFKSDPRWISKEIGVPTEQVRIALEQLLTLGLLSKDANGQIKKSNKRLTNFKEGQTSAAHKELQKSIVDMAAKAIDEVKQSDKDITSMTMAIDKKNLEKAKTLTKKFRRDMAELLESGDPSDVYQLGIQLYPVNFKK